MVRVYEMCNEAYDEGSRVSSRSFRYTLRANWGVNGWNLVVLLQVCRFSVATIWLA